MSGLKVVPFGYVYTGQTGGWEFIAGITPEQAQKLSGMIPVFTGLTDAAAPPTDRAELAERLEALVDEFQGAVRSCAIHGDKEAFVEEVEATKDALIAALRRPQSQPVEQTEHELVVFLRAKIAGSEADGRSTYPISIYPLEELLELTK